MGKKLEKRACPGFGPSWRPMDLKSNVLLIIPFLFWKYEENARKKDRMLWFVDRDVTGSNMSGSYLKSAQCIFESNLILSNSNWASQLSKSNSTLTQFKKLTKGEYESDQSRSKIEFGSDWILWILKDIIRNWAWNL